MGGRPGRWWGISGWRTGGFLIPAVLGSRAPTGKPRERRQLVVLFPAAARVCPWAAAVAVGYSGCQRSSRSGRRWRIAKTGAPPGLSLVGRDGCRGCWLRCCKLPDSRRFPGLGPADSQIWEFAGSTAPGGIRGWLCCCKTPVCHRFPGSDPGNSQIWEFAGSTPLRPVGFGGQARSSFQPDSAAIGWGRGQLKWARPVSRTALTTSGRKRCVNAPSPNVK